MPITKDHVIAAGVVAAVAMSAASVLRPSASTTSAPASANSAPLHTSAPPPDHCADACKQLAAWCVGGRTFNCTGLLRQYEKEGRVSCASPTQAQLEKVGMWCPDGGPR